MKKRPFWSMVNKGKPDECWIWLGMLHKKEGYGRVRVPFLSYEERTHRVAWVMTNGPIPDGLCVLHKCDNRACCNPDHLFLGTRKDNNEDRDSKGRQARGFALSEAVKRGRRSNPTCILRGSANGNSRLTEDDVRQMRAEYASGGVTLAALGKKYKLHTSTVCDIINRQCWRHVA